MGILKLFRLSQDKAVSSSVEPDTLHEDNLREVSENIFTDNSAPEPVAAGQSESNALRLFLDTDFYLQGYNDGYDNHSEESCRQKLDCIRHDFVLAVETVIAQKREFAFRLGMHIRNIGESSEVDVAIAQDKIREVNAMIERLHEEKDYALNNGLPPVQGLVMKPVSLYKNGFLNGLKAYTGEQFFAKSTGLFN